MPLFVEVCAGTGVLSAAFRRRGWRTVTVDVDAAHRPDVVGDVRMMRAADITTERPDFFWGAPPCADFSRRFLPWLRAKNPGPPDLSIVHACLRLRNEMLPRWWAIENVKGAVEWLSPFMGRPATSAGGRSVFLWGEFPPVKLPAKGSNKQGMTSAAKVARASYPLDVCEAIVDGVDGALRGYSAGPLFARLRGR